MGTVTYQGSIEGYNVELGPNIQLDITVNPGETLTLPDSICVMLLSGESWIAGDTYTQGLPNSWSGTQSDSWYLYPVATVTASGPPVPLRHNPYNASSGALTAPLPTGMPEGTILSVEKTDASTNMINATGNVRGVASSTISLALQHETVVFVADVNGSWWPFAGHKTLGSLDARYDAAGSAAAVLAEAGQPSGLATLTSGSVLTGSQVPPSVVNGSPLIATGSPYFNATTALAALMANNSSVGAVLYETNSVGVLINEWVRSS
jgi:hypothetical protein